MEKYNIGYWSPSSGWVVATTAELPTGSDEEAMAVLRRQNKLIIKVTPAKYASDLFKDEVQQ